MRVRSFTEIDQRQGRAVSWSRQSYYAGLAPSQGLSFPDDVAVYPLEPVPPPPRNYPARRRQRHRIEWDERQQHLVAGFLQSRVTAQVLCVRSRPSRAGLRIVSADGGNRPPQIENRLGTRIMQLLVRDADSVDYWAESIERGAVFQPQPTQTLASIAKFSETFNKRRPGNPEGFDDVAYIGAVAMNRGMFRFFGSHYGYDANLPPATMNTSVLETNLRKVTGKGHPLLEPRSYLAIVETSPEVVLGVESAREEASLHVIVGRW